MPGHVEKWLASHIPESHLWGSILKFPGCLWFINGTKKYPSSFNMEPETIQGDLAKRHQNPEIELNLVGG